MPPSVIDWQHLRNHLQPDGSLRDIYVNGSDEQVWQKFLIALSSSRYRCRLKHGERSIPRPLHELTFDEAATLQETDAVLLQIELSPTVIVNCHFFRAEEIELDVDPRELRNADAVCMVTHFMEWLARVVDRPVVLTHENSPEYVILRIENAGT